MAVKTFPYTVIYNGKLYRAGEPVETTETVSTEQEKSQPTKKAVTKNDKGTSRKA